MLRYGSRRQIQRITRMKIGQGARRSFDAPEVEVPIEEFSRRGAFVTKCFEGRVQNLYRRRRRPVPSTELENWASAQWIGKEKSNNRPKNPKGTALVVRGVQSLRFRRTELG